MWLQSRNKVCSQKDVFAREVSWLTRDSVLVNVNVRMNCCQVSQQFVFQSMAYHRQAPCCRSISSQLPVSHDKPTTIVLLNAGNRSALALPVALYYGTSHYSYRSRISESLHSVAASQAKSVLSVRHVPCAARHYSSLQHSASSRTELGAAPTFHHLPRSLCAVR